MITLLFGVVVAAISIWPMMDLVAFVHRIHQGDLEQELKLEYSTEFVQLSKQMNAMAAGLRDRMRLRNSLALAQEVQQNLLPSGNPKSMVWTLPATRPIAMKPAGIILIF